MFSSRASRALILLSAIYQQSGATAISSASVAIATPSPLVVPPSQDWDGNDGPWSSFFLRIGTPAQSMRVLVSTASNQPWVVLPQGCNSKDPADCESSRGGFYNVNASSSWAQTNVTQQSIFTLPIESNIGLPGNGLYGTDNVSLSYLGSGLPTLSSQLVAGIATKNFFMGMFGLNPASTNLSSFNNPIPSYISNLKSQSLIPSLSYAYTAGALYRFTSVLGSLTLGGYDNSLLIPNNLTFSFNPTNAIDLTVTINTITYSTGHQNTTLSSTPLNAFIDTTIPYLYLPLEVCLRFESAFSLTFDNTTGLYPVNDTLHTKLLEQAANVTFSLTNSDAESTIDITFPYQAFDLIAKWPLVQNTTRYFPLKRAIDSQIILGRTFLQEAYLVADYERSNFSLYQRKWDAAPKQEIIPITPFNGTNTGSGNGSGVSNTGSSEKKSSIPTAAIVGGAVGGVVLITSLITLFLLLLHRNKKLRSEIIAQSKAKSKIQQIESPPYNPPPPPPFTPRPSPPSPPPHTYNYKSELPDTSVPPFSSFQNHTSPSKNPHTPSPPLSSNPISPKYSLFPTIPPPSPPQIHRPQQSSPAHELPSRNTILVELPASPVRKSVFWTKGQASKNATAIRNIGRERRNAIFGMSSLGP